MPSSPVEAANGGRHDEALYRDLVQNLDEIVYAIETDGQAIGGRVVLVGKQVEAILGYRPEDFVQDPNLWRRCVHPDDFPGVVTSTNQIIESRAPGVRRYRIRHAISGEWRWMEDRFTAVFDAAGKLVKLYGAARDITSRMQDLEHLTSLSDAVTHTADSVLIANQSGEIEYINPAFTVMTGYTAAEVLGKTPRILKSGQLDQPFYERLWNTVLSGKVFSAVFPNRRKNGEIYSEEKTISPIRDPRGRIAHFVSLGRDITDRLHAQRLLRHQADLLENVSDAIIASDSSLHLTSWNGAAEHMYGWTSAEAMGKGVDLLRLESPDVSQERIWDALAKSGHWQGELMQRRKDGSPIQVLSSITLLRDSRGIEIGTVMVNRDVTEQRRLEAQIQQAQKMEAIGQLVGGIAHDFNNLLAIIGGHGRLLVTKLETGSSQASMAHTEQILAAAQKATDLTRQLLALGRLDVLEQCGVNLNVLIEDAVRTLSEVIASKVHLGRKLSSEPAMIYANAVQIEQVLVNLVLNARDAMPQGGDVVIETEIRDGAVMLAVTDTGVGMEKQVQERIFEPFFTTKPRDTGSGLGLWTVYGIVRQCRGEITVRSEPGKGSTFQILFPRLPEATDEPGKVLPDSATGRRILVADDEPTIRRLLREMLQDAGFEVVEAVNGKEALAQATEAAGDIDLILVDLVMPDQEGIETIRELRRAQPDIPIIAMSGGAFAEGYLSSAGKLGAHATLQKPFDAGTLLQSVRKLLEVSPKAKRSEPG